MIKRIKAGMVAGVTAVALWGGAALAQDDMGTMQEPETWEPSSPGMDEPIDDPAQTEIEIQEDESLTESDSPALEPVVIREEDMKEDEALGDARGVTVMLGGGVEGYTGALAPRIDPGASWGVTAALKPTRVLGLELSYSGAANEVDDSFAGGEALAEGPDIVRNGGQAVATVALTPTSIQPYLLGGFGISDYRVKGDAGAAGFSDDFNTHVPVGAGLRTHFGDFTADARLNYNVLLENDFASDVRATNVGGVDTSFRDGRYNASINLGTTF